MSKQPVNEIPRAAFERDPVTARVIEELKRVYKTKVLPLEQAYRFDTFVQPFMADAEFDAKPQVMLIGQYSVGKTSFIRYILGRDFPGQRIGPEPTTDRFVAVMDGPEDRIIPGNALAVSHDLPFRGLERFGVSFLNRFEGSQLNSKVLKNITLIDTPGVLSGEKQRVNRGYDFNEVCGWFAMRCDLILLLFDAHKLDISDEFKNAIEGLKGNEDKIRCILNKADQVDRQKLMRVYGALMWSLGKVMKTPEVLRVYIGSFWDQPLIHTDNRELFDMERDDLMTDLKNLPRNSAVRKINELVKRVRLGKVHAYVIANLKEQMPMLMGHAKKQKQLIDDLPKVFRTCMKRYNLAPGDFPDLDSMRSKLAEAEFSKFNTLKQRLLDEVETVLTVDLPRLMKELPQPQNEQIEVDSSGPLVFEDTFAPRTTAAYAQNSSMATASVLPPKPSRASTQPKIPDNPWGADEDDDDFGGGFEWSLAAYIPQYQPTFNSLQKGGLVSGGAAKPTLQASGLPGPILRKIWDLADIDKDGSLDLEEFVLVNILVDLARGGTPVPEYLDTEMIPPSKRR